jgi:8-oxo-dGTP pyrophosphatase MutT (NUDIX family)
MPDKKNRAGPDNGIRRQYAALPIRTSAAGTPEILLVTSRETRRWVLPKGWPMRKRTPSEAAAREAYEEAGLEGEIAPDRPIGSYRYEKRLGNGDIAQVEVSIFLLRVVRQLDAWPEQAERQTAWFRPADAADRVAEPELANILRRLEDLEGIVR